MVSTLAILVIKSFEPHPAKGLDHPPLSFTHLQSIPKIMPLFLMLVKGVTVGMSHMKALLGLRNVLYFLLLIPKYFS